MSLPKKRKECSITEKTELSDKTVKNKEITRKNRAKTINFVKITNFSTPTQKM